MPGGGWSKTTSSCITKSTCSATTIPYTSIFTKPETSVSTCVTSYPSTSTGSETKVYTTTEASSTTGKSTETVWSTVTKSNVWTTYTEVSCFSCPSSSVFCIRINLFSCGPLAHVYISGLHQEANCFDEDLGRNQARGHLCSLHLDCLRYRDQDHHGPQDLCYLLSYH